MTIPGTRCASPPTTGSAGPSWWRRSAPVERTRRLGAARFEQAVRREITRRGRQKPCLRIVRGLFTALADPAGVIAHRPGALERVQLLLEDWRYARDRLAETERRMTAVPDELGLTGLVTSMTGLSAIGAAAILAETGVRRAPVPLPHWSGGGDCLHEPAKGRQVARRDDAPVGDGSVKFPGGR
jgi:hypothetical protein